MNSIRRVIAYALVAVILFGPLAPRALGQQPAPQPSQPGAVDVNPPERQTVRGVDMYDVGAGVVTVAKLPFNVALCALGSAVGTALFFMTLGSAYKASTRTIEEGCAQRWIVRGDDLRPRGAPGIFPERPSDGYRR